MGKVTTTKRTLNHMIDVAEEISGETTGRGIAYSFCCRTFYDRTNPYENMGGTITAPSSGGSSGGGNSSLNNLLLTDGSSLLNTDGQPIGLGDDE